MEEQLHTLLRQFEFRDLEYCGSQGFIDGTKNAYYVGRIMDAKYEIGVRIAEDSDVVEIWEKMRSDDETCYVGKAKKAKTGWRILAN